MPSASDRFRDRGEGDQDWSGYTPSRLVWGNSTQGTELGIDAGSGEIPVSRASYA